MRFPRTYFSFLILQSLIGTIAVSSTEVKQTDALVQAEIQYDIAMERSFQGSTTSAMQALMDLESAKLAAAFKNGYKAYEQYLDSEKYEHLSYQTSKKKIELGAMQDSAVKIYELTATSEDSRAKEKLAKYDRKFLYSNESGQIAAEFEKRTGMPREEFFTFMVVASEKKIKPTDPNLFAESTRRFNALVAAIKNKKFKENVKRASSLVPESVQSSGVAKAVQKLVGDYVKELGAESIAAGIREPAASSSKILDSVPEKLSALGSIQSAVERAGLQPVAPKTGESESTIDSLLDTNEKKSRELASIEEFERGLQTNRELAVQEESIFQKVSKRYQLVAATRLGVREMEP